MGKAHQSPCLCHTQHGGEEEREIKIPNSQSALCIQAELDCVLSDRAVVVPGEENHRVRRAHNETLSAGKAKDRSFFRNDACCSHSGLLPFSVSPAAAEAWF